MILSYYLEYNTCWTRCTRFGIMCVKTTAKSPGWFIGRDSAPVFDYVPITANYCIRYGNYSVFALLFSLWRTAVNYLLAEFHVFCYFLDDAVKEEDGKKIVICLNCRKQKFREDGENRINTQSILNIDREDVKTPKVPKNTTEDHHLRMGVTSLKFFSFASQVTFEWLSFGMVWW